MINIPQKFDDMLSSIKKTLKGKKNPKTNKPYSNSDLYAIATTAYKKKYKKNPMPAENEEIIVAENVRVNFNSYLEVGEE